MNLANLLPTESNVPDALASFALLSTLLLAWLVTRRAFRARDNLTEAVARRWTANARNALVLIAIVGLLMIWAPQLRTFALSVTAVAVAIVVATKELLLCLSGSTFRTFTRAYAIGDLVQIGEHRGEVIDINLMSTRLRETERRDGSIKASRQSVYIPNSLLFTHPARVLARADAKAEHSFTMVFDCDVDLFAQREELEDIAGAAIREDEASQADPGRPRITMSMTDLARLRLEISVETTPDKATDTEARIFSALGSHVFKQAQAAKAAKAA